MSACILTCADDHVRPGADSAGRLLKAELCRYRGQHQREVRQQGEIIPVNAKDGDRDLIVVQVIQNVGLCIAFYDLLESSDGLIGHGTGLVNVNGELTEYQTNRR